MYNTIITSLSILTAVQSFCEVKSPTLCINQVTEPSQGFGDLTNQYAFAMQTFKNDIYVATLNAANAPDGMAAFFLGIEFESNGASVYRGRQSSSSCANEVNTTCSKYNWTPIVTGGLGNTFNYGVRKFASVGNFLYAVTGNHKDGFEIWRYVFTVFMTSISLNFIAHAFPISQNAMVKSLRL